MSTIKFKLPKINMNKIPQLVKDKWKETALEYLNNQSRDDIKCMKKKY